MKAIVQDEYGEAEVLQLRQVDKPTPGEDEVLLKVRAAALHAGDYFLTTGSPYLMRLGTGLRKPRQSTPGFDVAGVVEGVGANVVDFKIDDEVFGEAVGSCAEYVCTSPDKLVHKPTNLSLEHAAALAVSGVAALRGIRDAGKVSPGQHVLINGASGGVGTYAVQIAKALGAEVTGVCSTPNVDLVRSIGADHVIDYTQEDFTQAGPRYDLILDNVANHSMADVRRALVPKGRLVPNSGRSDGHWFGAFGRMIAAAVLSLLVRQQGHPFFAPVKKQHLLDLKNLIEEGKIVPVIARTYPFEETAKAMADVGAGHVAGKAVITI